MGDSLPGVGEAFEDAIKALSELGAILVEDMNFSELEDIQAENAEDVVVDYEVKVSTHDLHLEYDEEPNPCRMVLIDIFRN